MLPAVLLLAALCVALLVILALVLVRGDAVLDATARERDTAVAMLTAERGRRDADERVHSVQLRQALDELDAARTDAADARRELVALAHDVRLDQRDHAAVVLDLLHKERARSADAVARLVGADTAAEAPTYLSALQRLGPDVADQLWQGPTGNVDPEDADLAIRREGMPAVDRDRVLADIMARHAAEDHYDDDDGEYEQPTMAQQADREIG